MLNKKLTLVFDGDILAYRAASSVQRDLDWGDGLYTCHAFLEDAVGVFENLLESILQNIKSSGYQYNDFIIALSGRENFRKQVLDTYKANRANTRKPTCYQGLIEYIENKYTCIRENTIEADDLIGIITTRDDKLTEYIIVSMDKDFKTIPTTYYNFKTNTYHKGNKSTSTYWHVYQTLLGDLTDGYSGCPSYGKVSVTRFLDKHKALSEEDLWKAVIEVFESKGLSKEDCLVQARLAFILQDGYYNFETKQVKLWNFPIENNKSTLN